MSKRKQGADDIETETRALVRQRAVSMIEVRMGSGLSLGGRRNLVRIFDDPLIESEMLTEDTVMLERAFPSIETVSQELNRIAEKAAAARKDWRREIDRQEQLDEAERDRLKIEALKQRFQGFDRRKSEIERWFLPYKMGGRGLVIEALKEATLELKKKNHRRRHARRSQRRLTDLEEAIRKAIDEDLEGRRYCAFLDGRGHSVHEDWLKKGCPSKYSEAYKFPYWRELIYKEKSRVKRKMTSQLSHR